MPPGIPEVVLVLEPEPFAALGRILLSIVSLEFL